MDIAPFAKIRQYWALKTRVAKAPSTAFEFSRRFTRLRRDLPLKGSLARSFFPGVGKIEYITRYLSSTGVRFNDQRDRASLPSWASLEV